MKLKNYILACLTVLISLQGFAQDGKQKRADNLFNKFAFVDAAEVYHELIDKAYNTDYAVRQLADSYSYMRNPDSAVVFYQKAVEQEHVHVEYYYNYAQALRGTKDYKASRVWLKRFKDAGGQIDNTKIQKDSDFINSIFNAKQQYFLTEIKFNSKYSDFGAYEHDGNIYFASSRDEGVLTKHRYGWNEEPFLDIYMTEKSAVKQENVPVEYYYKYAQSLRGMKKYKESQEWLQRYKDSGGVVSANDFSKNVNFISSVFGAKQQYFLDKVRFNSKYSDFGAFEHDGKVYFASSRDEGVAVKRLYGWNEQPFLDVYVTKAGSRRNVDHTAKVPGDINSIYHDGPVTITKNGQTMYFSRNNFTEDIEVKDRKGLTNMKIYRATLVDSVWTNIEDLPINGDEFSTQHAALNTDDTKLYFTSDRPGGYGGSDIYVADINLDGSLGEPQNIGNVVNTESAEGFPFINNEGVLFFSSDGHTGLGLLDIFATIKGEDESTIEDVINLGIPVNSNSDDFAFTMNNNGITGYFASNRRGGRGSDDIYAFHREPVLHVEGTVTDAINTNPIQNAKITLFDENNKEIAFMETDENGYYQINIDRNKDYKIVASQDKYIDDYRKFTSKNIQTELITINANLLLNPVPNVVKLAELNTIYFDFDKHNIRPDAALELDKIVSLMQNDYPEMVIRIESHTDSRGKLTYNDKLSIDRANSTYEYIISKGIAPERITEHQGFGERRLTNGCEDGSDCEEKDHQLNRRTQFIVVKME